LADLGLAVGVDGAVAAGAAAAPVGLPSAAGAEPRHDGRDLVGATDARGRQPQRPQAAEGHARLDSDRAPQPTAEQPQGISLDRAYDNADSRELVDEYRLTLHIRSRGEEIDLKASRPAGAPAIGVVEACHSWLNRNRAILTRWSKKDENHLTLLQLASGLIAFKKAHAARLALTHAG
jgi:hypothetical protein